MILLKVNSAIDIVVDINRWFARPALSIRKSGTHEALG